MDGRKDTAVEALLEHLIEHGPADIATVFGRAFELAMQIERERFLRAGPYERTAARQGYANGYKPKRIDTPAGTVTVDVPKTAGHDGAPFYPQSLEPRWYRNLTARPEGIPAWDSLSADQKELYSHMMEVYAAALAFGDNQIGRLIQAVADTGEIDNTLIIFIEGDNGASAEGTLQGLSNELGVNANAVSESIDYLLSVKDELGGPLTYNHYPVGWAHAMNTPFQFTKQVASHFGGTQNGMVISWPAKIKDVGGVRPQFHHVIDIVPTLLEATGITFPGVLNGVEQTPIQGVSMEYAFDAADAPSTHSTQYFEMFGNRAIYHDGWVAATMPLRLPWDVTLGQDPAPDDFQWELYNVANDFSQAVDLAAENPDKLAELQAVFEVEAEKNNVFPLDSTFATRVDPAIRPSLTSGRTTFTYYPGTVRIPEGTMPELKNRPFTVSADVEIPEGGADGVIATMGGRFGGWALLMTDGKPEFAYAYSNQPQHKYRIAGTEALAPGKHALQFDFNYDGGGPGLGATGILKVDGAEVAQGRIEKSIIGRFSLDETFDVGEDTGTPVVEDYVVKMPFAFEGTVNEFVIQLR